MENILDRLQSTHPTLESAKHIVRNTIASFTEYFVRIGETLGPRAKTLEKLQRRFIWNNAKVPPLSYDQLSQETNNGGKKFFNIHHRNDAIALMHLKTYLNIAEDRTLWAFFADHLLSKNCLLSSTSRLEARINPFLQNWRPNIRKVNPVLRQFVKSADKYGVELDHSQMSNGAKRQLPLWHHVGELSTKRQYNNKPTSQCLRTHHKV
ncbi:hypothetical protein K435DRAFT_676965, partial [Dendrothele bispora CBS 962.96]